MTDTWGALAWRLQCPWCLGRTPFYYFLVDASSRLARHLVVDHPYELRLLEIALQPAHAARLDELDHLMAAA